MSDLPAEWAVVPVYTAFSCDLSHVQYQDGSVTIYGEESGGEWIQSDRAVDLTAGGRQ